MLIGPVRPLFLALVVTGVRALLALHRPDEAERWLASVREHLEGWGMAEAALAHAEGLIRLALGQATAARQSLETALIRWEQRGRTWEAAAARLDLAQCLQKA